MLARLWFDCAARVQCLFPYSACSCAGAVLALGTALTSFIGGNTLGSKVVGSKAAGSDNGSNGKGDSGKKLGVFKPGDKVVYPGHGVGEINTIVERLILGTPQKIFEITISSTGMRIMVPVAQAHSVGLRKVVDKKAVERVYEILRNRNFKIDTQTWNRRFREYSQKIETGSVFEIAEVLRDLSVLSNDKELSFGEKKMLDKARSLLVSEIAIAKARPHEKVMGELREIFA